MDVRSQFSSRYKKDTSIDNLRAKVARRRSKTQKENRHKEFRRSRGLSLADVNVSLVRDQELTAVEEMNESGHVMGHENKPASHCRAKEQTVKDERRAMLQRFKDEKQLRKLKEQREKASKGVFKCGIYKPETSFIPVLQTRNAAKGKQPPEPSITRVTRSTAKIEPPTSKIRTRAIPLNVLSNKAPVDRVIPKGRGQLHVVKKNESKVSAIPSIRVTRSAAQAVSKLPNDKIPPEKTTVIKSQKKKTTKEIIPEMVVNITESPVIDHPNNVQEPEPVLKDPCVEDETMPEMLPAVLEREPSFAPQNFVFQPLDGLSSLKFQPMTPSRASAFLTPTFTWSPLDGKRNFVVTREYEEDKIDLLSPTESSQTTTEIKLEVNSVFPHDKVLECVGDGTFAPQSSLAVTSLPPCEPSLEDIETTQTEQTLHDVPYFRAILKSEIQRLMSLCSDWDKRIDMDIPDDAKDQIRTVVGQTRLLLTERFKQFEGLVDNCEFKRGEKETTCTDLDGFWDMIYFQIEDVSKKFVNLGKLEENVWQQNTVQAKKVVRKKIASASTGKQNQGDDGRVAARSRLAAVKAAMKNRVNIKEPIAEVEAPVVPMQVDPIVFDAGFFRIESPAKLPGSLRINRSSSDTNTPKSTQKIVQNSGTPVTTEAAEGLKPVKSVSPVMSPIRKALFGIPEESLQNQEQTPILQYPEHVETDLVPAAVDLTKYLAPAQPVYFGAQSSGLMNCLGLAASETQDGFDTETDIDTSVTIDDVFMCSPEKIVNAAEASSLPSELEPDNDVMTTSDQFYFPGGCTQIMVQHSPMTVEPSLALTDLMTFSPMDE